MTDLLDAARRVVESTRSNTHEWVNLHPPQGALNDLEAALDAYEWSDEPPEEPGWYWARTNPTAKPKVREVRNDSHTNRCFVRPGCGGRQYVNEMKSDYQWAGPIPEPTDPNE